MREALVVLRQIAETTPDTRSFLALGLTLAKLNELDEAEQVLRGVIRLDAQNTQAHHFLSSVLFFKAENLLREPGGKEKALELFRQSAEAAALAVSLQPDNAMAHLTRGRALKYLGRSREALESLREAVLCRPEIADTHMYLGEALAEAGQLPEAMVHLENAMRFAAPGDNRPREMLKSWQAKTAAQP
jgi:Flp pilus assembly protein TadD